jgi:hypothetical protein
MKNLFIDSYYADIDPWGHAQQAVINGQFFTRNSPKIAQ